jgi:hypothetical protein
VDDPDHSATRLEELDTSTRRRLIARAVIVSVLIVAGLVTAYYLIPWEGGSAGQIVTRLVIVNLALIAVTMLSVQYVIRSRYPVLTLFQALAAVIGFALVAFASVYLLLSLDQEQAFSEPLGRTDALYFALTTATTVGYGDISARTEVARVVVMVQMVINFVVIGVATRALIHTAQKRIDRA